MDSVLTIGLAPTFQRVMVFPSFRENKVNRCLFHSVCASGKAINVTRVLTKLNREAVNITQLGGPRVGEFLSLCSKEGISVRHFSSRAAIRTCTTVINEEKGTSTELVEEAEEVEEEASESLYALFLDEIGKHRAVVISGTKAKGYSDLLIPEIVGKAAKDGKISVLDIKGKDLLSALPMHPTIIKPNLQEFCSTFSIAEGVLEEDENAELENAVRRKTWEIYSKYGTMTVITRGKYPTWYFDGKEFSEAETALDLPVVNTIGCGDTLTGVMTHQLLNGDCLRTAIEKGMAAATIKASHKSFEFLS